MNIRKPVDYSALYADLDKLMAAKLSQMERYREIGRLVSARTEKGAAVAASEYLQAAYPTATGFSPRNLRRMREFCRTYGNDPALMEHAMQISWTLNVIILEADLTMDERAWYIGAAKQYGWSKGKLLQEIDAGVHLEVSLDGKAPVCYTEQEETVREYEDRYDKDTFYLPWQYLPQSHGRVCDEGNGQKGWAGEPVPYRICGDQHRGDRQSGLSPGAPGTGEARDRLCRPCGTAAPERGLRGIRSPDWDGPGQYSQYIPHLRRRLCEENTPPDGLHRPPRRCGRPVVHRRLCNDLAGRGGRLPGYFSAYPT